MFWSEPFSMPTLYVRAVKGKTVVCKAAGGDACKIGSRRRSKKDFQYVATMTLLMAQLEGYLER